MLMGVIFPQRHHPSQPQVPQQRHTVYSTLLTETMSHDAARRPIELEVVLWRNYFETALLACLISSSIWIYMHTVLYLRIFYPQLVMYSNYYARFKADVLWTVPRCRRIN